MSADVHFTLGRNKKYWHVSRYPSMYSRGKARDTYCSTAATETTRWDFASSENNGNVVFFVMGRRHEGKLEWLLKEIRSPKENCRLSREAFLMFWFFVRFLWNTNPTMRIWVVWSLFRLKSFWLYFIYIFGNEYLLTSVTMHSLRNILHG